MANSPDAPVPVTLSFDTEAGLRLSPPKQVEVRVSPDLARTFALAYAFNQRDSTPLSFTSLLVGMLTGSEPASDWLGRQFEKDMITRIAARKPDSSFDLATLRQQATRLPSLPI